MPSGKLGSVNDLSFQSFTPTHAQINANKNSLQTGSNHPRPDQLLQQQLQQHQYSRAATLSSHVKSLADSRRTSSLLTLGTLPRVGTGGGGGGGCGRLLPVVAGSPIDGIEDHVLIQRFREDSRTDLNAPQNTHLPPLVKEAMSPNRNGGIEDKIVQNGAGGGGGGGGV